MPSTIIQCIIGNTQFFCPSSKTLGFSVERDPMVHPSVSGLYFSCSPHTIINGVSKIIIDSLQCQTNGWFSHVSQECAKIMPTLRNRNTSSPVETIISIGLAFAPTKHTTPCAICSRPPITMGATMFKASLDCKSCLSTAARKRSAAKKIISRNKFGYSTITRAGVIRMPAVLISLKTLNGQLAKTKPCQVALRAASYGRIEDNHGRSFQRHWPDRLLSYTLNLRSPSLYKGT